MDLDETIDPFAGRIRGADANEISSHQWIPLTPPIIRFVFRGFYFNFLLKFRRNILST